MGADSARARVRVCGGWEQRIQRNPEWRARSQSGGGGGGVNGGCSRCSAVMWPVAWACDSTRSIEPSFTTPDTAGAAPSEAHGLRCAIFWIKLIKRFEKNVSIKTI